MIIKECPVCKVEFRAKRNSQVCCSKDCANKKAITLSVITCPQCEETFKPRNKYKKFCSRSCAASWVQNAEERGTGKTRIVRCEVCNKEFKRNSKKTRFCSEGCYKAQKKGENVHNFNNYIYEDHGYLRYTPYHPIHPRKYVHSVLWHEENPNKKCERCNGEVEHVHHIDGNKKNNELNNLMGLCATCHHQLHAETNFFWQYR